MALPRDQRSIVFYSEGPAYWVHLEPIIHHLVNDHDRPVCYLSSMDTDPGLAQVHPRIHPFVIGDGAVRTVLFRTLDSDVLVMTMPDLDTYHIKRSVHPVHYVYVHHSLVSLHMVYRSGAFDAFESIFCVGPHHLEEARASEALYGLKPKELFEHGYGRLDAILGKSPRKVAGGGDLRAPHRILVAPSWGPNGLLETCGEPLVQTLLDAGYHVTVRPHPQTRKLSPVVLNDLGRRFSGHPRFAYEENIASADSLFASDLMVSDWSGAALDFAFGLERPVLFVDVPRKVNNPEFGRLNIEPLEVKIRVDVGAILPPERLSDAPGLIDELLNDAEALAERIRAARSRWVFNVGNSGRRGADEVAALADRKNAERSRQS